MQKNINSTVEGQLANLILNQWWEEKGFNHIITDVYAEAEQKLTTRTADGGTIDLCFKTDENDAPLNKTSFKLRRSVKWWKHLSGF